MNVKSILMAVVGCALVLPSLRARAVSGPTIVPTTGVDGFYSPADGYLHAVVASSDHYLSDVKWQDGVTPVIQTLRVFTQPIVGVAAYYSPNDQMNHAIVALSDNTLGEYYYNSTSQNYGTLPPIDSIYGSIVAISGHVDHGSYQHVVVATTSGAIILLKWIAYGGTTKYKWVIAREAGNAYERSPTILDVASLCDDNGVNHALVLQYGLDQAGYQRNWIHDISWTGNGNSIANIADSDLGNYYTPAGFVSGGFGAINWLNDTWDIAGELLGGTEVYDVNNAPPPNWSGYVDDIADPWGSLATGMFYQANGWCPNRHILLATGANALVDYEKNACFPNNPWHPTTLGYGFNF